jgi:hypothetical protein
MKTKTYFAFRVDIWDDAGRQHRCRWRGRLRGGGSDLPGSRGALASGAHHPTAGHPGGA